MSILQSTFDKHKKLMLESVGMINETELYHATDRDNLESFKSGIDISKAGTKFDGAGGNDPKLGQGKGFYVFKKKQSALAHAKQTKQDTVVVIDQDINSNNFDIDYEVDGHLLRKVFSDQKVVDYLIDHLRKQNIKKQDGSPALIQNKLNPDWSITVPLDIFGTKMMKMFSLTTAALGYGGDDTNVGDAAANARFALFLQQYAPELFNKFEQEYLPKARGLKYNGKEKIFPIRIEDLQGNILWQNKK